MDHSGAVDLEDAIYALNILIGVEVKKVYLDADVNNDKRITMVDCMYILQHISGLR